MTETIDPYKGWSEEEWSGFLETSAGVYDAVAKGQAISDDSLAAFRAALAEAGVPVERLELVAGPIGPTIDLEFAAKPA